MMEQQLAALAVEAATMVARGQDEVFDLLAQRAYELFSADAGVGVGRLWTDREGALEFRLSTGGVPPLDGAWMERAKDLAPQTPSILALARAGVHEPVRVSDVLDLRRFRGTKEFAHLHGVHGGRYPLGAALVYRPDELVFIGLHRVKRDFDDDEVANLRQLQRVLAQAFSFRRTLDDAVRDMTQETPTRTPVLPWLRAMNEEFVPTRREAEVLALVVDGWTNQQIATRLGITERTVRKHLSAVYEQAGLAGRVAAAGWWRSRNISQA
jgi:DNA-binding CsgD family transcriptional regulator